MPEYKRITIVLLTWREEALLPVRVVVEGPAVVPVLPVALVPAGLDVGHVGQVGVGEGEVVAGHVDVLAVGWHWYKVLRTLSRPSNTYRLHTRSPGRRSPWRRAWSWPGRTAWTPPRACRSWSWCSRWRTGRRSWSPGYRAPGSQRWSPHFVSERRRGYSDWSSGEWILTSSLAIPTNSYWGTRVKAQPRLQDLPAIHRNLQLLLS